AVVACAAPTAALADDSGLPPELGAADVALYRQIFVVQEEGRWNEADALIARIENPALMGHVRFQRLMHPTAYRSSYAELRGWLSGYADQPDADRIYRLALRRKPGGASNPRPPADPDVGGSWRLNAPERVEAVADVPTYRPASRSAGDWARVRNA